MAHVDYANLGRTIVDRWGVESADVTQTIKMMSGEQRSLSVLAHLCRQIEQLNVQMRADRQQRKDERAEQARAIAAVAMLSAADRYATQLYNSGRITGSMLGGKCREAHG